MNIVYLHQYFNTPQMTGSTRSYEFSKRLVEKGNAVHVVSASNQKEGLESYEGINIHWIKVPYSNHMPFHKRIISFMKFSFKAFIKAKSLPCDVLFATSTPLTIAIPGILIKKIKNIYFIFEVRDLWPSIPIAMGVVKNPLIIYFAKMLERTAYKSADHIIALSPGMKEGIEKVIHEKGKVSVIPNCSDVNVFQKINAADKLPIPFTLGKKIILYPGTIGFVNGCEYLVDLAEGLNQISDNIIIVIVGDGIEKNKLLELAKHRGILDKSIYFLDPVEKKYVPMLFNNSSAIISTIIDVKELEHNSANKFFDALASGKPIFINHGGWQADIINRHSNGLSLDRNKSIASSQIFTFFSDEKRLQEAEQSSLKLAKEVFDREILFAKLYSIFNNCTTKVE